MDECFFVLLDFEHIAIFRFNQRIYVGISRSGCHAFWLSVCYNPLIGKTTRFLSERNLLVRYSGQLHSSQKNLHYFTSINEDMSKCPDQGAILSC